ncbi:MAG: HNH endonuclease, partial [Niabella sp.]|nr:HNH endonuclease [Niabella sp.]
QAMAILTKEISKSNGIEKLVQETNMNKGSAQMIVGQIFPKFFNGEKFTRTLNVQLFDDLLSFFLEDYGVERLQISLSALKKHIDYIQAKGDPKIKLRKVYQKYLDLADSSDRGNADSDVDEKEQTEIANFYKNEKNRTELISELRKSQDADDEEVIINLKKFKRNNKTIALIKMLRDFECQICKTSIMKKDGSKYIEAAHITPKHKKGKETESNIILLCPNHHKEFDYGNLSVIEHTDEKLLFSLNGKTYKLNLQIK